MNKYKFIIRNLWYFRKKNLSLALGVAISTAVITGSLIVGDSVKFSLESTVRHRLGNVEFVLKSGDAFFTHDLASHLSLSLDVPVSPVLFTQGSAVAGGGSLRLEKVQVMGVGKSLDEISGLENYYSALEEGEVIISENMAKRLGLSVNSDLLLRINRTSLVPLNAPFVSDRENVVSILLRVRAIAGKDEMGMFNLKNSQSAPFNAFLNYDALCRLMEFNNRANLMLFPGNSQLSEEKIASAVRDSWSLEDAGLSLKLLPDGSNYQLSSDKIFFPRTLTEMIAGTALKAEPLLSYFVNKMELNGRSTPYSFVTGLSSAQLAKGEIIINEWLAEDLSAKPGDSLRMEYFRVGPLRELTVGYRTFTVKSIIPVLSAQAGPEMMPDLPGMSDAGNCRDWETGVPVRLDEIRDKDEQYWKDYRGTPKAFISLDEAVEIWENRFGIYTAVRYPAQAGEQELAATLLNRIDPAKLGFVVENVRTQGETAALNGVDFSGLFAGLGFFLLAGGIFLTILLFLLNLESRKEQLYILSALGIKIRSVRFILMTEGMLVAGAGVIAGLALGILYNRLIFSALNSIWYDIVRADVMLIKIRTVSLLAGAAISMAVAWMSFMLPLNRYLLRSMGKKRENRRGLHTPGRAKIYFFLSLTSGAIAALVMAWQLFAGEIINPSLFFLAGGMILISGITWFSSRLSVSPPTRAEIPDIKESGIRNIYRNPLRSLGIVILFSLGTFMVVSTGSNRKIPGSSKDPSSGTGGFLFYAETTVPVLKNLEDTGVKYEFGLSDNYSFLQLRLSDGDDASCLNLNKIANPAILGVKAEGLEGRFSFVSRTDFLDKETPWISLEETLPGGLIPAIADETVIKWGLGKKAGDTLSYLNASGEVLNLLLIGGTAPSVFQGKVLISDSNFLEAFPGNSGSRVFLIDAEDADTSQIQTETMRAFRDYGWDMQASSVRLAGFNSVTNTYLAVFLVLGALGLLLGTVGLGIVLSRTLLERKTEIALMRALGFSLKSVATHIRAEYLYLMITGTLLGFLSAITATLPSLIAVRSWGLFTGLAVLLVLLIFNGWLWTGILTARSLRNRSINEALRNE